MRVKVITPIFKSDVYNILDFGAKPQINFNNKFAIQAAIDECSNNGGGTVLVPNGYFYTGPFVIKSNDHAGEKAGFTILKYAISFLLLLAFTLGIIMLLPQFPGLASAVFGANII
jgi:polygalacturonase